MADSKRSSIVQFALLFLAIYIGTQLLFGTLFPKGEEQQLTAGPELSAATTFTIGTHPVVTVTNRPATAASHGVEGFLRSKWCSLTRFFIASDADCGALAVTYTGTTFALENRCPKPPVDVFRVTYADGAEQRTEIASGETAIPCTDAPVISPGASHNVSLAPWKYSIFGTPGTYEIRLPKGSLPPTDFSASDAVAPPTTVRFSVVEPGVFRKLFRTFITEPFLNFLVFAASVTPGHSLGIAIIVLTLIVKLLLYFPTQHAMEGQKKMQLLQPKLEELKRRYKDDAKRMQEETMKLWKEHNINPLQSCLPMLIQFPILIGLFYVIRDGSNLALSREFLYGVYSNLDWQFGTNFLWLDLLTPDVVVMPVLLVALQFLQMKMAFAIQKRKKRSDVVDVPGEGKRAKEPMSSQDMQQKMMLYALPLMIGFFALSFPSAVSLYWGVSTLFAIGQQMIVNREHLRV